MSEVPTKPSREQFLAAISAIEKFSPAPMVLSRALQLVRDPRSDIASIADLIRHDSALSADLLRCANSAFYGRSRSSNVDEAVQVLGMQETIRVLNLAVAKIVSWRDLDTYGIKGKDYWAESLFNALFLQGLAERTGGAEPGDAYTTGLFRYIGRLTINQVLQNGLSAAPWAGGESISDWELEAVGLVQSQAGAMLLGRWLFPEPIVQSVAAQDARMVPAMNGGWLSEALRFSAAILPQGLDSPFRPVGGLNWGAGSVHQEFMERNRLNQNGVDELFSSSSAAFYEICQNFWG